MAGVRSSLVALLSGVVVAGMVSAPPAAGAGSGVRGSAPQVAVPAVGSAVVVPLGTSRKRPTVRLRSNKRLVVNVDPNLSGSRSWKFVLQHKSGGVWSKMGVYRTRGAAEVRRFRVEPGKYRVRVRARPGYQSVTTKGYWHTPTVVTTRVSVRTGGGQADRFSYDPAISADGRWITYASKARNLVANDTNKTWDVFLFDRDTGHTRRVSVRTDGGQADSTDSGGSGNTAISADGRWITYDSRAPNLVDDDTNNAADVFLFDRVTGHTERVSVRIEGDLVVGDGGTSPAISADGRWITYTSGGWNPVDGDTSNTQDVFLFDRDTGITERVSVPSDGDNIIAASYNPAISADGRWITYNLSATTVIDTGYDIKWDVVLFDRDTGITRQVSVRPVSDYSHGWYYSPAISADGRLITYTSGPANMVDDDTNNKQDVFLFDRDTGRTERVSVPPDGGQAGADSYQSAISADGRWITYSSRAGNLVDDDTNRKNDVFLYDRDTGRTERVSVPTGGGQANSRSGSPAISADGRWITYGSNAANLVDNDTNGDNDVFLTRMW